MNRYSNIKGKMEYLFDVINPTYHLDLPNHPKNKFIMIFFNSEPLSASGLIVNHDDCIFGSLKILHHSSYTIYTTNIYPSTDVNDIAPEIIRAKTNNYIREYRGMSPGLLFPFDNRVLFDLTKGVVTVDKTNYPILIYLSNGWEYKNKRYLKMDELKKIEIFPMVPMT